MATNYNKMVVIQFNEEVNVINFEQLKEAFRAQFKDRQHYHGSFIDRSYKPVTAKYMKNSDGEAIKTHLLLIFDEPLNIRKTETPVKIVYTASMGGGIYGALPKDILPDFAIDFIPTNIDMYQNPEESDTVTPNITIINNVLPKPIIRNDKHVSTDTVVMLAIYVNKIVPTQIGDIKP